ncbi:MAG: rod-binding protein [Lachnospiraceae bacterium]|nr:rod-binding protein [Lachnospiraceae bacterium]
MAISMGTDYTGTYGDYADVSTDRFKDSLSTKDLTSASDDELMEVCKEFESYLVEQMYKAMEKTVMKDEKEEESSDSYISGFKDYFGDMRIQEYAKLATENTGLGIAQMLYEQLKVNVAGVIPQAQVSEE